jgi:hypothetical protein
MCELWCQDGALSEARAALPWQAELQFDGGRMDASSCFIGAEQMHHPCNGRAWLLAEGQPSDRHLGG